MRRGRYVAPALMAALLAAAACGGSDNKPATGSQQPDTTHAHTKEIAIQTFRFQPTPLEVPAGSAITWTNRDDIQHTVTAGTPDNKTNRFDMQLTGKGTTVSFTFAEPGTYSYFCARHESMRGEVRVTS